MGDHGRLGLVRPGGLWAWNRRYGQITGNRARDFCRMAHDADRVATFASAQAGYIRRCPCGVRAQFRFCRSFGHGSDVVQPAGAQRRMDVPTGPDQNDRFAIRTHDPGPSRRLCNIWDWCCRGYCAPPVATGPTRTDQQRGCPRTGCPGRSDTFTWWCVGCLQLHGERNALAQHLSRQEPGYGVGPPG